MGKNYDMIVIGGGTAGLCAAAKAVEYGVKSIAVLEAFSSMGGSGRFAQTIFGTDFADHGDPNSDANAEQVYKMVRYKLHNTGNPDVQKRYIYANKRAIRWLEDRHLTWTPLELTPWNEGFVSRNVEAPNAGPGGNGLGAQIGRTMLDTLEQSGSVDLFTKTHVERLMVHEDGSIKGCVADVNGVKKCFYGKTVVLSCGSVSGNKDGIRKYMPDTLGEKDDILPGGLKTCRGDSIGMAQEIGAKTMEDLYIHMMGPFYPAFGSAFGTISADPRGVVLYGNGRRALNEALFDDAMELVERAPGKIFYHLFSSETLEAAWKEKKNPELVRRILESDNLDELKRENLDTLIETLRNMPHMDPRNYPDLMRRRLEMLLNECERMPDYAPETFRKRYEGDIKTGSLCIADTLEEAAAFIGCDPDVLKGTVKRYNNSCAAGFDEQFLKDRMYMMKLESGPYYVLKTMRSVDNAQGGISIDGNFNVLRLDGTPIEGLYAAGDNCSGFVTEFYAPSGAGLTFALTSGMLVGEIISEKLQADC